MPVSRIGEHASVRFTKDAIPVTRDKIIKPVANSSRDDSGQSPNPPDASQHVAKKKKGIAPGQQLLVWLSVIAHRINSVEIGVINVVTFQQIGRERALQGREPEPVMPISLEEKLHGAIAETANTVVKHNRAGYRFRHESTSNLAE